MKVGAVGLDGCGCTSEVWQAAHTSSGDRRCESPWETLEAPYLGNEDGVMPGEKTPGKPTTRRYSDQEKAQAVRLVRQLRAELGTDHGTV